MQKVHRAEWNESEGHCLKVFMRQAATETVLPSAKPAGARQDSDGRNKRALGNAGGFTQTNWYDLHILQSNTPESTQHQNSLARVLFVDSMQIKCSSSYALLSLIHVY